MKKINSLTYAIKAFLLVGVFIQLIGLLNVIMAMIIYKISFDYN